MFRVDVYQPKEETPSLSPLYACLATASDNGRLLTVGRKNATILLESDKSVSRDHLHLHLMSKHKEHQDALILNGGENPVAAAAMVPEKQEEKNACDQNSLGMALLVSNLGKFGSAVLSIAPKALDDEKSSDEKATAAPKTAGSDSETDAGGSDTEDESQQKSAPPGGLPVVEGVTWFEQTQKLAQSFSNITMTPKKMGPKESFAVPGNASTILIQCGQVGSLIVLTRLDLHFAKSSKLPSEEFQLWKDRLYAFGGEWIENHIESHMLSTMNDPKQGVLKQANLPPTTYMVIPGEREASVKQLVAWQLDIPITTTNLLQALLKRKAPNDPWPKIQDFTPANKANQGKVDDNFWDADCPNKSSLWKSCTLVTAFKDKPQDTEYLVRSAGADVVSLVDMKAAEFEKRVKELAQDPDKKDGLFSIAEKHRSKASKLLKTQGIANIAAKDIVRFICNQELPQDKDGHVIGKVEQNTTKPSSDVEEEEKSKEVLDEPKETASDEVKPTESEPTRKSARSPKRKRGTESEAATQDEEKSRTQSSKKSRNDKSESQPQRGAEVPPTDVQQEEDAMKMSELDERTAGKKRSRENEDTNAKPAANRQAGSHDSQTQNKIGSSKARLERNEDGWFVAAPKDDASRRAYLKPRDEMLENCSLEKPLEAAPTDFCGGLIFRKYDPNHSDRIAKMGRKTSGGADFKKFHKNLIKKGSNRARIPLRAVLPKETVRQKQLEEQQRTLEVQQRKADELFHGEGGPHQSRIKKTAATRKRRNV